MTRLYLNQPLSEKSLISLSPEQSHYLVHVLRQNVDDTLQVFNAEQGEWWAKIDQVTKKQVSLQILFQRQSPSVTPPLWLAFAPLKQDATNFLLEKSTELGVTHLQPLWMEHSNTQRLNQQRWEKIVIEASEQCERHDIPYILPSLSLSSFLQNLPAHIKWFAALERQESTPLLTALQNSQTLQWGFIVGPEGGFSKTEQHLFNQNSSICAISLGPRILRAETAGLCALSVAQSLL